MNTGLAYQQLCRVKMFRLKCEPAKLYKVFMKASWLEECKHKYNKANIGKDIAKGLLVDKSSSLDILESEVKKWKKKFQETDHKKRKP